MAARHYDSNVPFWVIRGRGVRDSRPRREVESVIELTVLAVPILDSLGLGTLQVNNITLALKVCCVRGMTPET